MDILVTRSKGEGFRKYIDSTLTLAQSYVARFDNLKCLVGNFESFRGIDLIRNVLFHLCVNRSPEILTFEKFLGAFDVLKWEENRLNEMRKRLTANAVEESTSALMEGIVTMYYALKIGIESVVPSPEVSNGKRCDVKVVPVDRPVFMELTSLGTGLFEEKLESVFITVADRILQELEEARSVKIEVDAVRFPLDSEDRLDTNASVEKFVRSIERLRLVELFNSPDALLTVEIDEIASLPYKDKTILEHDQNELIPGQTMLQAAAPFVADLMIRESFKKWSANITPSLVADCPVVYFTASDAKWPLVMISTQLMSPSEAARREWNAFLRHLKRMLKQKIEHGQLQANAPNIIVVKASNWLSYGFEDSEDTFREFPQIETSLLEVMNLTKNPHLTQVRIYERDYSKARIIPNPHTAENSKLTAKEALQLG